MSDSLPTTWWFEDESPSTKVLTIWGDLEEAKLFDVFFSLESNNKDVVRECSKLWKSKAIRVYGLQTFSLCFLCPGTFCFNEQAGHHFQNAGVSGTQNRTKIFLMTRKVCSSAKKYFLLTKSVFLAKM